MRLTLRTLLAYLDDTLPASEAKAIGEKVADSPPAKELIDRIRRLTRKRSLAAPSNGIPGSPTDPNVVSDYLSDTLAPGEVSAFEEACLSSDTNLAEVAACHQILTLLMSEPVRVPPTARQRMYRLVKGPASQPSRRPGVTLPVGGEPPEGTSVESFDADATLLLGVPALAGADTGSKKAFPVLIGIALFVITAISGYLAWPKPASVDPSFRATEQKTIPTGELPRTQPTAEVPKSTPTAEMPRPGTLEEELQRQLVPVPRPILPD